VIFLGQALNRYSGVDKVTEQIRSPSLIASFTITSFVFLFGYLATKYVIKGSVNMHMKNCS
jgi:hypothetical protein